MNNFANEERINEICRQVENDFKQFPNIKTTEDFFIWREQVKEESNNDGKLRNKRIEDAIKGNSSLELLNDWSKCYRMIDRTKAKLYMTRSNYNMLDDNNYRIKATIILHNHLIEKGKANTADLFGALKRFGLNYPIEQRTISTSYEFERCIVKEEDNAPWPSVLFITLLKAYGIEGEDLLEVGRKVESLGNYYIEEIVKSHRDPSLKPYVYTKK